MNRLKLNFGSFNEDLKYNEECIVKGGKRGVVQQIMLKTLAIQGENKHGFFPRTYALKKILISLRIKVKKETIDT